MIHQFFSWLFVGNVVPLQKTRLTKSPNDWAKRKMSQDFEIKGYAARWLGDQLTSFQKFYFWIMVLSLLLWPIPAFVALFFFDAPSRSTLDDICRSGMAFTIWLYPLYLLPLIRLWFRFSKRIGATWLYYFCPFIPVAIFYMFMQLDKL